MDCVEIWFDEGSSSDSGEEALLQLRRQRRHIRDNANPLDMDENLFISNFGLNKETFKVVLKIIDPKLPQVVRQSGTPNILKLAVTLRFCAQGSYQSNVGDEGYFGLSQPTVSLVMSQTLDVMEKVLCPKYIKLQYTEKDADNAKLYFYNKCGIPGVIGAIDGTHIKIIAPAKNIQHLYYNSNCFYSINTMIMCDHNMLIRYISAKYPGSSHDSLVFNMSPLKTYFDSQCQSGLRNTWLLGDAAYALQPYLLTPYRDAEEESKESRFNIQHSKGRKIVERVISIFKNRWRCMLGEKVLHYNPEKASQFINVCAALHNICQIYKLPFNEGPNELFESSEEGNDNMDDIDSSKVKAMRDEIARSLIKL